MKFEVLNIYNCDEARTWRNQCLYALRTPYELTPEMEDDFYKSVISNRNARARFWGIWDEDEFIGMTGLENIEWENRIAEISIMMNPEVNGRGYGTKAVDILLDKGFNYLNLQTIYGEVYEMNPAVTFWQKIIKKYNGHLAYLPKRKYWDGEYYGSWYFSIDKEDYNGSIHTGY